MEAGNRGVCWRRVLLGAVAGLFVSGALQAQDAFRAQNQALFEQLREVHGLNDQQMSRVRQIFEQGGYIGQGNPAIATHPATPTQCEQKLARAGVSYANAEHEAICGGPYMAPLYDPSRQTAAEATACVDKFEFPDIPCSYPVVWVRAREAAQLCEAVGKRLCDAHEWESACEGRLTEPDYRFDLAERLGRGPGAVSSMRSAHNRAHAGDKRWGYGPAYQKGVCAAASQKSAGCQGGGWSQCGSNTYPTGFFPDCRSELDVYDVHGNAAEHMNLPLAPEQMASRGSSSLGMTEMKGSWFIFDRYYAHEDWCRWRAPFWHGTRVMDTHSHHNYHLGFRCCKTLD
ncbi:MAG: hypothetical protein KDK91_16545 [Gammaproteobacteria bacterium]|nr:hypothetical protein [Gammaproteobacteria bacterium]